MRRSTLAMILGIGALAAAATFVASSRPDGLERVATDLGFADRRQATVDAPMPGYEAPVRGPMSGVVAGLVGALAVGGLAFGAGRLLARRGE